MTSSCGILKSSTSNHTSWFVEHDAPKRLHMLSNGWMMFACIEGCLEQKRFVHAVCFINEMLMFSRLHIFSSFLVSNVRHGDLSHLLFLACRREDLWERNYYLRWTVVNISEPRKNGHQFSDDIFKCLYLNKNVWISIRISLMFVPKGPINNIPALVQIMVWYRIGNKPLSETMLTRFTDAYMRHYGEMS